MHEEDVLTFDKGIWTDKQTGNVLPSGTLVQGKNGTFRLDIDETKGFGSVVCLSGTGSQGMGKYIEFSEEAQSMQRPHSFPLRYSRCTRYPPHLCGAKINLCSESNS